jgi:hypothetical protein
MCSRHIFTLVHSHAHRRIHTCAVSARARARARAGADQADPRAAALDRNDHVRKHPQAQTGGRLSPDRMLYAYAPRGTSLVDAYRPEPTRPSLSCTVQSGHAPPCAMHLSGVGWQRPSSVLCRRDCAEYIATAPIVYPAVDRPPHGRGGQPGRHWAERASNSGAHACTIAHTHYHCNRGVHR